METLRYDYRPKTWVMALAGLFFAGCAVILIHSARDNDRGMVINRVIDLDTAQATILLWVLATASVLFVAVGLYGVIRSLGQPRQVIVDRDGITAPKSGMNSTVVVVRFATITDLKVSKVQSQRFLTIHHQAGKLTINDSMMPSRADFDEMTAAIVARWEH